MTAPAAARVLHIVPPTSMPRYPRALSTRFHSSAPATRAVLATAMRTARLPGTLPCSAATRMLKKVVARADREEQHLLGQVLPKPGVAPRRGRAPP